MTGKAPEHGKALPERKAANPGSRGFTLLEMIIAITLVGVVIVVVAGAMRLAYRSVAGGEKKIESLERFRSSFAIVDAQIQSAAPLTYDQLGTKKPYFEGSRELIRMATNYSIWGGRRGCVVAEYVVRTDENGKVALVASEAPMGSANKRTTILFKGFDQILFEYYSQDTQDDVGEWIDEWADEEKLPFKVRISVVSGMKVISLIIPVRTEHFEMETRLEPAVTGEAPVLLARGDGQRNGRRPGYAA